MQSARSGRREKDRYGDVFILGGKGGGGTSPNIQSRSSAHNKNGPIDLMLCKNEG